MSLFISTEYLVVLLNNLVILVTVNMQYDSKVVEHDFSSIGILESILFFSFLVFC